MIVQRCEPFMRTFVARVVTTRVSFASSLLNLSNSLFDLAQNFSKKIPPPPENCCMSGCPNCVWLVYAEELLKLYKDGGSKVSQELEKKILDPGLKSFIQLELRNKLRIKPDKPKQ